MVKIARGIGRVVLAKRESYATIAATRLGTTQDPVKALIVAETGIRSIQRQAGAELAGVEAAGITKRVKDTLKGLQAVKGRRDEVVV